MADPVVLGPQPVGNSGPANSVPRPVPPPPRRGPDLSRAEMEEIIAQGGSINYKGRIIAHADLLPDDAELAGNDAEKQAEVAAAIDAQIAALNAARARLAQQPARKDDKPLADKPKA